MIQFSEETKERIGKILDITREVVHYGYLPLILYLGYTRSEPKPALIRYCSTTSWVQSTTDVDASLISPFAN
ncbi:hypothetical protein G647_05243 [Cladophialophora carrionii CBS 160.54]|uniref:Mitochondrial import receptor subunit TOM7 n=1 Tax=Cladophialophora carrionii CBS 160.54 TaxID=1279043 RepID=V9D9U2_9EURO|nr:uncharacterized protein G647_05243 [Cladophialophora carrionii CBS 160.54]ETI23441.1 hypothetical protein G647_05243 [Cladophialophora carrionii CBS 160.54]